AFGRQPDRSLDHPAAAFGLLLLAKGLRRHNRDCVAGNVVPPPMLRLRVSSRTVMGPPCHTEPVTVTRVLHHVDPDSLASTRAAFPDVVFVPVPRTGPLHDDAHGDLLLRTAIGGPHLD